MKQKDAAINIEDSVVCLTDACNYRCIFCSRRGTPCAHSPALIKEIIKKFPDNVCFEGGEPMLAKDLGEWVAFAKGRGVKDIILVTNSFGLDKPEPVKKLLGLGVTMFNVNFPAHNPKLYGLLTGTNGRFRAAVTAVKNLIRTAGPEKVRLTMVANSVMTGYMKSYAEFLVNNFHGLFYVEINMIKILGSAAKRTWLVPELAALEPGLLEAFSVLEKAKVCFITDGFPLCRMPGYEDHAIDTRLLISRGKPATREKGHAAPCRACTLKKICPGPRKDYLKLHGPAGLVTSKKDPAPIIAKTRRLWLSAR